MMARFLHAIAGSCWKRLEGTVTSCTYLFGIVQKVQRTFSSFGLLLGIAKIDLVLNKRCLFFSRLLLAHNAVWSYSTTLL